MRRKPINNALLYKRVAFLLCCILGIMFFFLLKGENRKQISSEAILLDSTYSCNSCDTIIQFLLPYKDSLDNCLNKVIGFSKEDMNAGRPESLLSNFVADLLLEKANEIVPTDIAIVNLGGLRSNISKGNITVRNIYAVMPFENTFSIVDLEGKYVMQLAQEIASVGGEGFAGMKIGTRNKKAVEILVDNFPLDVNKTYRVATSDYLLTGKDHMLALVHYVNERKTSLKIRDVITNHIEELTQKGDSVSATLDGRMYEEK